MMWYRAVENVLNVVETDMLLSTYGTPELSIVAFSDHCSLTVWAQSSPYKIEGFDESLAIVGVQSILWRFAHGDDEDVAIVAIEC